jgi:protease-4
MIDDDREYLQGLIDGYYDEFLDRVAEGRGPEREAVADTEARVYLGEDPRDLRLVDRIGTREDVEDALAERIGVDSVSVTEFEPRRTIPVRLGSGARSVAYAFGAGVAGAFGGDAEEFEFRV